jgi:hypothetical protein
MTFGALSRKILEAHRIDRQSSNYKRFSERDNRSFGSQTRNNVEAKLRLGRICWLTKSVVRSSD